MVEQTEGDKERTEEDKITQAGIVVTLGGTEYTIAPLVIKYSRDWRKKAVPLIGDLYRFSRTALDEGELEGVITQLFTGKTDAIIDSFFEYARDLPRDKIEESATDGEIILAFMEVFNAFVAPLSAKVTKAATSPSEQPSSS